MTRLPDRFDLWVRKARACGDAARGMDYVLGALAGLREWHFLNVGTSDRPQPAEAEAGGARCLLVFSDVARIEEIIQQDGGLPPGEPLPVITMPTAAAMTWCLGRSCEGLLVNPGEEAFVVSLEQVRIFHGEWSQRGGRQAAGFWIPNMTTEEEDFWQEQGL